MAGNFVLVEGADEVRTYMYRGGNVDEDLRELTSDIAEFAGEALSSTAPGKIGLELVRVDTDRHEEGRISAVAGVIPDLDETLFGDPRGLGSDPADYPFFVDVGTGIFGPLSREIVMPPGHHMGPIPWMGGNIYVQHIKGQEAQHYSDKAYQQTVDWIPERITAEKR